MPNVSWDKPTAKVTVGKAVFVLEQDAPGTSTPMPLDEAIACALLADELFRCGHFSLLAEVHQIVRVDLLAVLPIGPGEVARLIPDVDADVAPDGFDGNWRTRPFDARTALLELEWLCRHYHLLIPNGPTATVRAAFARALALRAQ